MKALVNVVLPDAVVRNKGIMITCLISAAREEGPAPKSKSKK